MGVEVEDITKAPWDILFRGPEDVLRKLLASDWGLSPDAIDSAISQASDTDVDVRKVTQELLDAAANKADLDDSALTIQEAIGVKTGDVASHFFTSQHISEWISLDVEVRRELLERYIAFERLMNYPDGFKYKCTY